jgi:hypothetical protein
MDMPFKAVQAAMRKTFGVETSLVELRQDLDADRDLVLALTQEEHAVLRADPVQADVHPNARQFCAARLAMLRAHVGPEIGHIVGGRITWGGGGADVTVVRPAFPDAVLNLPGFDVLLLDDFERAVAVIVSLVSPDGLTVEQRLRRLAEIAQEREAIRSRHAQKVDDALALGIRVEHLPETVTLRNREKQARERVEHEERDAAYHARVGGRP